LWIIGNKKQTRTFFKCFLAIFRKITCKTGKLPGKLCKNSAKTYNFIIFYRSTRQPDHYRPPFFHIFSLAPGGKLIYNDYIGFAMVCGRNALINEELS